MRTGQICKLKMEVIISKNYETRRGCKNAFLLNKLQRQQRQGIMDKGTLYRGDLMAYPSSHQFLYRATGRVPKEIKIR